MKPRGRVGLLLLITALSLCWLTLVDRPAYLLATRFAPRLAWIPDARFTSLFATASLYALLRRNHKVHGMESPRIPMMLILLLSGAWVAGAALTNFGFHTYSPPLPHLPDLVAFLFCGLLAEEFLFRGIVFEEAFRIWKSGWGAVALSALTFSLAHLQYHHFSLTPAAWAQLGATLPMGVMFGFVRWKSQHLWPGIAFHFLNNLFAVLAGSDVVEKLTQMFSPL